MICGDPPVVDKCVVISALANDFDINDQTTSSLLQILLRISARFIKKSSLKSSALLPIPFQHLFYVFFYIFVSFINMVKYVLKK
jgi:Na+/alanine symporter